jgi:aromatic-L-amino-acid decarboxylase
MNGDNFERQTGEFVAAVERAARWIAGYFAHPEDYPVLSSVRPGKIRDAFPADPPPAGRSLDDILDDFESTIVPGVTHWNHPSFFAYFSITGSYPGIVGELLSAALNVNGMLWRTSPALTELEMLSLDYLRRLIGLGESFFGQILDTASTSSLVAMTAAREALPGLDIRLEGMAGRHDVPQLVMYTSGEAHSSIDKAAIVTGIGARNVRHVRVDERFRMDPQALVEAIEADIAAGFKPFYVVATVGTTSTTSVDPVPEIADVCEKYGLWLHVDAAYAWAAAILPEKRWIFGGCDRADSIVVNPHKWLFTPIDLSVLFCRRRESLRESFSLVPEYLKSNDEAERAGLPNLMDYSFQLGRRFRALKLWMVINYYGVEGLQSRIREHIRLAEVFRAWAEHHPDFVVVAPVEFSAVCFRFEPPGVNASPEEVDALNETLLDAVNRSGRAFLSHTRVNDHFALRCAIGNIRTTEKHIVALQHLLEEESSKLKG